ncbi:transcription antitermination factor NusB [Methyloligella sp. 2.7D]|uniref:transcription antitermination factor NusB n=1 Tax=unclassified Methyloligella TaxID=2625955 RepID=UPI00157C8134|nr:transcription antitermination factor NusB [Methyloligella sp. GL2]QKP77594.1 transcription antitermination factor NusB [Methyloligella sp. GL2]
MAETKPAPSRASARSAARLAAIQALYQMDMTGIDLNEVVTEFAQHRLGSEIEGEKLHEAELAFFDDIVRGVVREQRRIDPLINARLAEGWHLSRIDSTLRAILRSGTYEILLRDDVPPKVAINEYLDLAKAFFEGDERKVVNGLLDRIAREVRPEDLPPRTETPAETAASADLKERET